MRQAEPRWIDAHTLLSDEDRWAMDYESLLAFEQASDNRTDAGAVRELMQAGLSQSAIAQRLSMSRNAASQAVKRIRRAGCTQAARYE